MSNERKILSLANQITNWDKIDANNIIKILNEFYQLTIEQNFIPENFGINKNNIPSEYIPNILKESGQVLATDKNNSCIFGASSPFKVISVKEAKKIIKNSTI